MTGIALAFELRKFGKFGPNLVRRRVGGLRVDDIIMKFSIELIRCEERWRRRARSFVRLFLNDLLKKTKKKAL